MIKKYKHNSSSVGDVSININNQRIEIVKEIVYLFGFCK